MILRIFDRDDAAELLRRKLLDKFLVCGAIRARALAPFDATSMRSGETECYHRFET